MTVREAEGVPTLARIDLPAVLEMQWRSTGGKCRALVSSRQTPRVADRNSSAGFDSFGNAGRGRSIRAAAVRPVDSGVG
jgi:hypothetical protein